MGEPLANYDNLLKRLKILHAPWGGDSAPARITISTSGLAPGKFASRGRPLQFLLAFPCTAATDETRTNHPFNRMYRFAELPRLVYYQQKKERRTRSNIF